MRRLDETLAPDAASAPAEPPDRVLQLEQEVRTTRALLEVRNEAFRVLLGRLVESERLVHHQARALRVCDTVHTRLEVERDKAVETANVLQQLRLFRTTRAPRAVYGYLLRLLGRR